MTRLFFIDVLRFLAIFFVTGFHVARYIGFDNLHSFGKIFKNLFITGGWLGCCLFFLISGYCLCLNYNENTKYFDYLKHRLIRLLPTYYVAMVIWYFLIKMGIAPKPIDLSAILSHVFLLHNLNEANFYSMSGVFWFLGVLFDFYLIFPFLYKLQKNTRFGLEILTLILFVASIFITCCFHIRGSVFNKSILINLPCFVFGMILCKKQYVNLFFNKYLKAILLIISLVLLIFAKNSSFMGAPIDMLAIIESILVGIVCFSFKNELEKIPEIIKNFISQIALASYSIYLYNYIFHVAKPVYFNSTIIFIYILFVLGFGLCMYELIEKPINKFIYKLCNTSKEQNFKSDNYSVNHTK